MARGRQDTRSGQETIRLVGAARRGRAALLLGTALQASTLVFLATPGRAQPAPNARPSGGVVTAGSATIGSSASTTTITQGSQRAAINWQSFNVGSAQTVDFVQPSSSAVALNRVIGPDPSQIAGHIDANGQIILINQSGVIFYQGAQVNTAGLIVSAAGMSNVNFMAGKLVFDQAAHPNAAVVNQGTLTVQQAGLAALVAPQVANSGVITAKLGHVVLAGAKTATLDLYGDGMLALDVNNAVTQAPTGPGGAPVTALVTNTGVIRADGGTVQLTAREADGLVQNLVQAGGKIVADSVGSKTGTVVLGGLGGSIVLSGVVAADGNAPGNVGGQVQADASQGVTLTSAARVSASGAAGGGTVAIGTTLARAESGPSTASALTASTVQVDPGATIAANATGDGNGGRVTALSRRSTSMAGDISAIGGPHGGNGGFVEVSGEQGFALTGAIDVSAQLGNFGTILLDPANLTVISGGVGSGDQDANFASNSGTILATGPDTPNDQVSNGEIEAHTTGDIVLQAVTNVTVSAPINLTTGGQALTMQAGNNLVVQAGASITTAGNITLSAADSTITGFTASGGLTVGATVSTSAGTVKLSGGTTGITLNGNVSGTVVDLNTTGGGISQAGTVAITAGELTNSGGLNGNVALIGTSNSIGAAGGLVNSGGDITLVDNTASLGLVGTISANNLFFEVAQVGGTLALGASIRTAVITAQLTAAAGGRISLVADHITETAGSRVTATGGAVELAPFSAINTSLLGSSGLVIDATLLADINTGVVGTLVVGGFTDVPTGAIAPAARAASISVDAATDIAGSTAGTLDLLATGQISQSAALTVGTLIGNAGTVMLNDPGNDITTLGGFAATAAEFELADNPSTGTLTVAGPVTAATIATVSTGDTGAIDVTGSIGAGSTLAVVAGSGGLALNGNATLTGTTIDLAADSGTLALNGNAVVGQSGALVELIATGNITQATSARLVAATLAVASNAVVDLAGTANAVGAVGPVGALTGVVATTSFTLNDNADLTVNGELLSPQIALLAPGQTVTLGAGAAIITGGTPPASPGPLDPAQEPANGAPGAYIEAASFTQIGASTLTAPGRAQPTLEITVSNSAQFDPPLGLLAGNGWLILNLGGGTAAGNVFVNALNVTFTGAGGANLGGTIAGIAGGAAAAAGFIQPAVNISYLFNGCEIGAAVCLPIPPTPPGGETPVPGPPYLFQPSAVPELIGLPPLALLALPLPPPPACALTDPNVVPPNGSSPSCALTDPDVVPPNVSYVDY